MLQLQIRSPPPVTYNSRWTGRRTAKSALKPCRFRTPGPAPSIPSVVPNFLFLCDGYKAEDKPEFEGQVRSLLGLMKKSTLTRPFDLLATSMNYYQAFIPSNHHGISVLCEVYPDQNVGRRAQARIRVASSICIVSPTPKTLRPAIGGD